MASEMVERVRAAIQVAMQEMNDWPEVEENSVDWTDRVVRAAIAAMREPTPSMVDEAYEAQKPHFNKIERNGVWLDQVGILKKVEHERMALDWRAMVEAALREP